MVSLFPFGIVSVLFSSRGMILVFEPIGVRSMGLLLALFERMSTQGLSRKKEGSVIATSRHVYMYNMDISFGGVWVGRLDDD